MARSVPAFLGSAGIIVLAVREGVMLRLYPSHVHAIIPRSPKAVPSASPPSSSPSTGTHTAVPVSHGLAVCRGLLPHTRGVRTAEGTTLLYRLPHPRYRPARIPAHQRGKWSNTSLVFMQKKKKKRFFYLQTRCPSCPSWAVFLIGKGGHTGRPVWGWLSTRNAD